MMRDIDLAEVRLLGKRLLELERERSEARDQARVLVSLQAAFTSIAIARSPNDVVAHMLRAARDPLGFSRAIYYSVDRERGIEPRFQVDCSDVVEPSSERIDIRPGSSVLALLRRGFDHVVGQADDLSAPFVDVRNWYALSAVTNSDGAMGMLYVDGHRVRKPREWEVGLVHALTTIASVSIENSVLLARTQELAMRDPLTGLFNRRAFAERLLAEIQECRAWGKSLAYVMIDVDDFKEINDSFGHAHGDAVLRSLAETLTRSSRTHDVVGRYAGDEFVVLLCNVDPEQTKSLVARLSHELQTQNLFCSLGVASFPKDAQDAGSLLAAADRALYRTKANGKNGFTFA